MHDEHPHPLLAQVPLTVSPFLNLPTATPLPYSYKQLPSTLPPSILSSPPASTPNQNQNQNQSDPDQQQQQQAQQNQQPAYIVSTTGTTATPDTILSSCLALQQHLSSLESNAKQTLQEWEARRKAADLAEKRRVAPGWLDNDVHLLKPENVDAGQDTQMGDADAQQASSSVNPQRRTSVGIKALVERRDGVVDSSEGEALDRAFGGLDLK